MQVPWLEALVGTEIVVDFGSGQSVGGFLQDVIYEPGVGLVLVQVEGASCDGLINYRNVNSISPCNRRQPERSEEAFGTIEGWLKSITGATVTVGDCQGKKICQAATFSGTDDSGPLTLLLRESEQGPPRYVNWDRVSMVTVHKQAVQKGGALRAREAPDEGWEDGPGGEALGVPSPLRPKPSDSAKTTVESGAPRKL